MNDDKHDEILSLVGAKPGWSRRAFLAGSVASCFALAVQPACPQTAIHTADAGLATRDIRIPTVDGSIGG